MDIGARKCCISFHTSLLWSLSFEANTIDKVRLVHWSKQHLRPLRLIIGVLSATDKVPGVKRLKIFP